MEDVESRLFQITRDLLQELTHRITKAQQDIQRPKEENFYLRNKMGKWQFDIEDQLLKASKHHTKEQIKTLSFTAENV
jgi:hypothetical protein